MLLDTKEALVMQITKVFVHLDQAFFHAPFILLLLITALSLWRLWTFTLLPWLNPNEPKEVPYWIPCKSYL
jgi:hypothetical protein